MVKQMRALVDERALGAIRWVSVSYTQDWLSRQEDTAASARAAWRTDPARSGETGAFGGIGSHTVHLVEAVTGEPMTALAADLRAGIAGRRLDDDGAALFRLWGARSRPATSTGSIWRSMASRRRFTGGRRTPTGFTCAAATAGRNLVAGAGTPYLAPPARAAARLPAGHPEGYIEAFANIYAAFSQVVAKRTVADHPGFGALDEALRTMRFLRAARTSSDREGAWVYLEAV